MDKSKVYIKMCEKAVEIQEKVPKEGVGGTFIGNNILYHIAPMNQSHDMDGYYYIEDKEVVEKCETCGAEETHIESTKCIWLPTQSGLQAMVDEDAISQMQKLWGWIVTNIGLPQPTMEQLWLEYVMWTLRRKIWDSTSEDWIKKGR